MSRIFINYRREDSAPNASRIYEWLSERYGDNQVFMDVDTIEPGLDWMQAIDRAVGSADLVLAVIGADWLNEFKRRGFETDDPMRHELETALARENIRVIPLLVNGAKMPPSSELPPTLASLARRHALEIMRPDDERFQYDKQELLKKVDVALGLERVSTPAMSANPDGSQTQQLASEAEAATVTMTNPTTQTPTRKTVPVLLELLNQLEVEQRELDAYVHLYIELESSERPRKCQELVSSIRTYVATSGAQESPARWPEIEKSVDQLKPLGGGGNRVSELGEAINQFDDQLATSKSLLRQIMDPTQKGAADHVAIAGDLLQKLYSVGDISTVILDACRTEVDKRVRRISELLNLIYMKAPGRQEDDVMHSVTFARDLGSPYVDARTRKEQGLQTGRVAPLGVTRTGP